MKHGFLILAHKETDALYYFIETILTFRFFRQNHNGKRVRITLD